MLPKKSIENIMHITPAISDKMTDAIQLWSDMYEGHSPWLKEPTEISPERIVSLGLPALIASEKARMATLEMKSSITPHSKQQKAVKTSTKSYEQQESGDKTISDETNNSLMVSERATAQNSGTPQRAEFLNKQYTKLKKQLRRQLEYGIAKGGLVIKPYIVQYDKKSTEDSVLHYNKNIADAEIEFDVVQADRFFPLSFDSNGKVTEAVFVQTKVDKAKERVFIRLEHHKLEGHTVTVQNLAFESTDMSLAYSNNIKSTSNLGVQIKLTDVPEWASLAEEVVIEDIDRLLFAYFRMPEANTVDPYSPLGVSGYSRVVNLIKDADNQYSRLLWEYEGGELAIDVDRDALKFVTDDGKGGHTALPLKQERLFRKVDLNNEETYQVFAPPLRDVSLINGLNNILMRIEDATGLSRGTISDNTTRVQDPKTATELRILRQRSYASNLDIQLALQDALTDVIYVMDVYCTLYKVTPEGDYDVSFEWDDSILVDSESELSKRLTLMKNGISSKLETRMWYYGETEEQAKQALAIVQQEAFDALKQNVEANQMMAKASGGQSIKSAGDTSSDKQSTGKQADSLVNPDKSKDNNAISGKNFTKE